MLMALISAFAMSQAFRTVAAIMAAPVQLELGLSSQELGIFPAAFHLAFGSLQLAMGLGIDVHGVRRTMLCVFPLAIIGAFVSSQAANFGQLLIGQALIGLGCAPAYLSCSVFIGRNFPVGRFAALTGFALGLGTAGTLLTGTPLAWLIEARSWRAGFVALGCMSIAAWLFVFALVREAPSKSSTKSGKSIAAALLDYGELFRFPQTSGVLALSIVALASYMSLRGLWLGPLLVERHGMSLIQSGNVALAVSVTGIASGPIIGWLDPGPARRVRWIFVFALTVSSLFAAIAVGVGKWADIAAPIAIGLLSGYTVLQQANVRSIYPEQMMGRALAGFTMVMFLGIAVMQWLTGLAASAAAALGIDPFAAVFGCIAVALAVGAVTFWVRAPVDVAEAG